MKTCSLKHCNKPHEESGKTCAKCKAYYRSYHRRHKEKRALTARLLHETNPALVMLRSARSRARAQGLPCTISVSDILVPICCPILGVKLVVGSRRLGPNSPSLDRIIPELGYVPGNISVISFRANAIKNDGTLAEHEAVVTYMRSNGV